jgi:hypothetical protein
MGDIALRGNKLTKGPHGHGPKPFLNRPGQAQGTHGGKATGGRRVGKFGGGRTRLLEELGRVEAEPSNRNRRAEIARVHGELNKGYATGGRVGLKKGGKPWGTGPKPGTLEFFQVTTQTPKRKGKAIGGPAARAIKQALKPKGEFKKDKFSAPWEKPPQLKKSQKERREELRKKARKSGGHSKIVFADEWDKIDPGLQKGLFKKDGGRAGLKKGGKSDKKWIQKAVNPKHKGYCTPMTKKTCTPARKALARTFKKKAKTGWS